ncbi:MAG: hypothetical protein NT083_04635 [Rhodocyclales bacterium]|nr:hypothetical protein [Rhodocyclales bacterium]
MAYRLLFGREPESETVVTHYATEVADLRNLRELFINSAEFAASLEKVQGPRPPRPPFNGPPMEIELAASSEKLAALFAKTSGQWHHLGETEPHWSVLTNESYFQENFHMNRAAFYASGESELKMFEATLARAGVAPEGLQRCLELGCGVGRVGAALRTSHRSRHLGAASEFGARDPPPRRLRPCDADAGDAGQPDADRKL